MMMSTHVRSYKFVLSVAEIRNNSFDVEKPSKRRRYSDEESSSFHSPHIDVPLDTASELQHSTSSYSTGNQHTSTTEVWKPQEPVRPVKLVTYKKRFKSTPANRGKVNEPLKLAPKVTHIDSSSTKVIEPMPSSIADSLSIKTEHEGLDITADSVQGNEITETVRTSDITNTNNTVLKVEPNYSDDIEVLGVEPGTGTEESQADRSQESTETSAMNSSYNDQSGMNSSYDQSGMNSSYDQSGMNSSYDQSFSIGDNTTGPNTSMGELSLSQAG